MLPVGHADATSRPCCIAFISHSNDDAAFISHSNDLSYFSASITFLARRDSGKSRCPATTRFINIDNSMETASIFAWKFWNCLSFRIKHKFDSERIPLFYCWKGSFVAQCMIKVSSFKTLIESLMNIIFFCYDPVCEKILEYHIFSEFRLNQAHCLSSKF